MATDGLEESSPLAIACLAGATAVDEAVVVRTARLAVVQPAGGAGHHLVLGAEALRRLAMPERLRVRDPAEVDDRILHRDLDHLAEAALLAVVERGEDPDRAVQSRAGVGHVRAGLDRGAL